MREAVICEPLRTPVGGFGGSLRDVPAVDLASTVIRALMERTALPPEQVDEVILGHCYPTMDAPAVRSHFSLRRSVRACSRSS